MHYTQQEYNFFRMMQANTGLQELNISYHQHNIIHYIEHIVKLWRNTSCLFRLNLIDRMKGTQGRFVAQLAIQRADSSRLPMYGGNTHPLYSQQRALDALGDIKILKWDCDVIFGQLSDYSAIFLDIATLGHPSVLIFFALDVSRLLCAGLASIAKYSLSIKLGAPRDHVHSSQPEESESIIEVLGPIQ
ncbi:MAG: hypothetical protein BYD32DRAFT_439887 [Podila humilis]|nr:MAG: hypothetical protein BYD32DRAFT_439887 [Podila humilis]